MALLSVQIKKYGGEVLAVTNGENHKIFSVIAKALKNGGKHFMDIMNGSYAQTHFPCKLWDAGEKGLTLSAFEWEKERKTLIYGPEFND